MNDISDEDFNDLVDRAFDSLSVAHRDAIKNVAIVLADEPTEIQRHELSLRRDQTLLGLYSGVPLTERGGRERNLPDVITLFKTPLLQQSHDLESLYDNVRHTLWHEVAHYFGLNHEQISDLEP